MEIVCNDPLFPSGATELDILVYPDPILKKVATPVEVFDNKLKQTIQDMLLTMYRAPGIGLAAPQVGLSQRFFVMDVDYKREQINDDEENPVYQLSELNPRVFINPVFVQKNGETTYEEGCLSVPGIYDEVKRAEHVVVEYYDENGEKHQLEADELLSICIQHENDHLDGIVFIEKLSKLKLNFYKKKLAKHK